MRLGIDLDNTIVCYDELFQRLAVEQNLCPPDVSPTKTAVRDHLRATGREPLWTRLQGEVYGPSMHRATPFPGVEQFLRKCRSRGVPVAIVSHRSRYPYAGEQHDLHLSALNWLRARGFHAPGGPALAEDRVFLEHSKHEKLARIAALDCTHFIDDLPELLTDAAFPEGVEQILFDPNDAHGAGPVALRVTSWDSADHLLLGGG